MNEPSKLDTSHGKPIEAVMNLERNPERELLLTDIALTLSRQGYSSWIHRYHTPRVTPNGNHFKVSGFKLKIEHCETKLTAVFVLPDQGNLWWIHRAIKEWRNELPYVKPNEEIILPAVEGPHG